MAISIGPRIGIDGEAEYRKQLQNIIQSTKTLDSEMKKTKSSFDESTSAQEKAEKQLEILQQKQEKLQAVTEKMAEAQQSAIDKFGEGSTEAEKWTQKLNDAETELNKTNTEIENQQKALESAQSPMEELTQTIAEQESELQSLQTEYENAYLKYGENSDQVNELSEKMSDLSGELQDNRDKLNEVQTASSDAAGGMQELASETDDVTTAEEGATIAAGMLNTGFSSAIGGMVQAIVSGDITSLIGGMVDTVLELNEASYEMQTKWDEATQTIANGTGAIGEELEKMTQQAREAWASVAGGNDSAEAITAMLDTRAGFERGSEAATTMTEAVMEFQNVTGSSGVDAVNNITDSLKQWGMWTDDQNQNMELMVGMLNEVTEATQLTDLSASEVTNTLIKNKATYEALDMSMEDAINQMVNYRDAGGDVSDISSAMQSTMKKCASEGLDFKTTWTEINAILGTSMDAQDKLNHSIGGTDKSLQDIIGKGKAQTLVSTYQSMESTGRNLTVTMGDVSKVLTSTYEAGLTTDESMDILNNTMEEMSGISAETLEKMEKLGIFTGQNWPALAKAFADSTTEKVNNKISEIGGTAEANMNQAKTAVVNTQNEIQNHLNSNPLKLSVSVPNISIDAKGKATQNGVQTFAKAMNNAYIVGSPTYFMAGEAGSEVVVGESHLYDQIAQIVKNVGGGDTYNINGVSVSGHDVEQAVAVLTRAIMVNRRA